MTDSTSDLDTRALTARQWAMDALKLSRCEFGAASADASFRRYFRIAEAGGTRSWIVMDAPPERENCEPFIRIACLLADAGLHVPEVLHQDLDRGFLLLTDLGRQTYLHVMAEDNAERLFEEAIVTLVRMQAASRPDVLPPYDRALLERELALFPEWFVQRHLGRKFTAAQSQSWSDICEFLMVAALAQPQVFVHRDFMPRNLMLSSPNPGVLDFQDAVFGPVTYDLVCLFKDAFLSWPEARVERGVALYRRLAGAAGIPQPDDFQRAFDWMGVHRHLKVLGIFARIRHRDGKPQYLEDAPRFIRYVRDVAQRYAELAPLTALFDDLDLHA